LEKSWSVRLRCCARVKDVQSAGSNQQQRERSDCFGRSSIGLRQDTRVAWARTRAARAPTRATRARASLSGQRRAADRITDNNTVTEGIRTFCCQSAANPSAIPGYTVDYLRGELSNDDAKSKAKVARADRRAFARTSPPRVCSRNSLSSTPWVDQQSMYAPLTVAFEG
jgi:hypothetical protein